MHLYVIDIGNKPDNWKSLKNLWRRKLGILGFLIMFEYDKSYMHPHVVDIGDKQGNWKTLRKVVEETSGSF
jgi:hypothetical protein